MLEIMKGSLGLTWVTVAVLGLGLVLSCLVSSRLDLPCLVWLSGYGLCTCLGLGPRVTGLGLALSGLWFWFVRF
jgi:hypothetical protein